MTTAPSVHTLECIVERSRSCNAVYIRVLADQARVAYAAAGSRQRTGRQLGPLDGVPVAVKDNIDVAGVPTTNGSVVEAPTDPALHDAIAVQRLRRQGMVVMGKANLSELAFSGLGTNEHYGSPVNPVSTAEPLVPGGSSSGSAVAVASGLVPVALGTDTSGSVRVPAAFCGVVGYKSSEGLVPLHGVRGLSDTLDSIGILARSTVQLRQTAAALGVRSAYAEASEIGPPRLVVPDGDEVVEGCEPAVRHWFEHEVRALESVGIVVERRPVAGLRLAQELMDDYGTIVAADAYARYRHLLDSHRTAGVDQAVIRRLRAAAGRDEAVRIVRSRMASLRARAARELGGALLICPTVRHSPPTSREVARSPAAFDRLNASTLRTTMLLSYLGMPGVSLPIGAGRTAGLGLLVSGPLRCDIQVLRAASVIERATTSITSTAEISVTSDVRTTSGLGRSNEEEVRT